MLPIACCTPDREDSSLGGRGATCSIPLVPWQGFFPSFSRSRPFRLPERRFIDLRSFESTTSVVQIDESGFKKSKRAASGKGRKKPLVWVVGEVNGNFPCVCNTWGEEGGVGKSKKKGQPVCFPEENTVFSGTDGIHYY